MASTTLAIILFVLCLATGLQASTPYTSCSTPADPMDFRMEGCTESPCSLVRGQNANAEWDFEVTADTKKLTPRVRATVFGIITVNYDIGQENACDTLTNAECPLDKEEEITYSLSMPVLESYPKLSLTIEFALLGDDGEAQVCFQIAATVVDP